jgi:hypothetical protein
MNTTFTAGEWTTEEANNGDGEFLNIYGPKGQFIGAIFSDDKAPKEFRAEGENYITLAEALANARLIKAAPKLLDSLEDLIAMVDNLLLHHKDSMSKEDYAGRRETLKKAVEINTAAGGMYDWNKFCNTVFSK